MEFGCVLGNGEIFVFGKGSQQGLDTFVVFQQQLGLDCRFFKPLRGGEAALGKEPLGKILAQ